MDFTTGAFRLSARLSRMAKKRARERKTRGTENIAYKSGIFGCRDATGRIGVEYLATLGVNAGTPRPCVYIVER